jgi:tetratricopeptide (TPR) repeat protein
MLTEDYIIRMINLAIAALLRILGLKKGGDYQEALLLIDVTLEQLLGLRSSMAKNLDDNRMYYLLTRHDELDTQRLAIVADLFHEEGDIYAALGREQESREDYARALRFDLEVLFNEGSQEQEPLKGRIEELIGKLEHAESAAQEEPAAQKGPSVLLTLGSDTLWPLAGYFEESGAYARAEAVLLNLAGRPEIRAEIAPEVAAFYERMAEKQPGSLARGGLSIEQVREGQAKWRGEG